MDLKGDFKDDLEELLRWGQAVPINLVRFLKVDVTQPGQSHELLFNGRYEEPMRRFVVSLREEGLDIGKKDSKYGYRMPLPKRDHDFRVLEIYRRAV